jgi:Zn-dependent protease/CBS domain-containing protein
VTNVPSGPRVRTGLVIARVRGVPVVIMPSWLLIAALLAAVYAPIIDAAVTGISTTGAYIAAAGFAVLFGLCVLAHELGHTVVSIALGHPVRRVVLFALGGLSEIDGEPERPRDELLVAAAGPLVSLIIAGGAWLGYDASPAGRLVTALLDGGRLLRATVCAFGARPITGTRVAAWAGRVLAVAVAVSGLVADRTSLGIAAGVVTIGLAAYLWLSASQALRVAGLMAQLPDVSVAELLRPGVFVPADVSVADALRRAWDTSARGLVLIDRSEQPTAIVDEARIGAVPPDQRPWTPVADVARRLEPGLVLPDTVDAAELLRRMQATPAREYLVVHADGSAAGIITTRDFASRLTGLATKGSA